MGADLQGQAEEGSQPPPYICVTWSIDLYSWELVQEHLAAVKQDFGYHNQKPGGRYYRRVNRHVENPNSYVINYYFQDPMDAVLFSLKYVK